MGSRAQNIEDSGDGAVARGGFTGQGGAQDTGQEAKNDRKLHCTWAVLCHAPPLSC